MEVRSETSISTLDEASGDMWQDQVNAKAKTDAHRHLDRPIYTYLLSLPLRLLRYRPIYGKRNSPLLTVRRLISPPSDLLRTRTSPHS